MTTSPTTVNPTDPCGELLRAFGSCSMEAKIDAVLNIGSFHQRMAEQAIRDEVAMLCGRYRSRDKPHQGRYQRWGSNPGSIRLCGQRVPIRVPRVQDKQTNQARSLQSYRRLHNATVDDKKLTEVLLMGVSQRNYQRAAQEYADAFGLSATSVRRRFIQRGQQILHDFFEHRLDKLDLVGLWIDGKHFAKYQVVVAMGLTLTGEKVVLGFAQVPSENTEAIEGLLEDLIARGLRLGEGLLCMVDGSKGIHAAVRKVFGKYALVQRCCWHKQENVVAHVKKEDQPRYRKRLQSAYRKPTYAAAKAALTNLQTELQSSAPKAAASLAEGMEQTLTLHRLGLAQVLGRSLRTTNSIENLNSAFARLFHNVTHWMHSGQVHRWIALGAIESLRNLQKIPQAQHLPKLRMALQAHIGYTTHSNTTSTLLRPPPTN